MRSSRFESQFVSCSGRNYINESWIEAIMNYQAQRKAPVIRSRVIVSFILIFPLFTCFDLIDQLSLNEDAAMQDFDKYLESYVGASEHLALLLDYDGTLAPIAPHPNLTHMTDETKSALNRIARSPKVFTAVISGRAVDNVKEKIGIDGLIYAGNHGLEISYPNGTSYNHQIPENISGNFDKMTDALNKIARDGSWLENKGVSLTFHYRAMPDDQHDLIRAEAREIIEGLGYRANQAHCAIEAKPPVLWHKGKAAEYILSHNFGEDWRRHVKVLFAGDDTTDEDVFELLQGTGVTFRVTKDPEMKTKATYKVPSTESVTTLLQWVEERFSS